MGAFSRTIWGRRFPQVSTAAAGGVLTPGVVGTTATVEDRRFPQLLRIALPLRVLGPRSYGSSTAIVNRTLGARWVRSDGATLTRVFGV